MDVVWSASTVPVQMGCVPMDSMQQTHECRRPDNRQHAGMQHQLCLPRPSPLWMTSYQICCGKGFRRQPKHCSMVLTKPILQYTGPCAKVWVSQVPHGNPLWLLEMVRGRFSAGSVLPGFPQHAVAWIWWLTVSPAWLVSKMLERSPRRRGRGTWMEKSVHRPRFLPSLHQQ